MRYTETFNGVSITADDASDEILKALEKAKKRALEAIGITAEAHAKEVLTEVVYTGQKPWPLTGRLRNSITHATKGDAVYIGTNVEYAPGIEFGTHRKAGAVHYLQKAATQHSAEYKELIKESLKNA